MLHAPVVSTYESTLIATASEVWLRQKRLVMGRKAEARYGRVLGCCCTLLKAGASAVIPTAQLVLSVFTVSNQFVPLIFRPVLPQHILLRFSTRNVRCTPMFTFSIGYFVGVTLICYSLGFATMRHICVLTCISVGFYSKSSSPAPMVA